MWGCLLGFRGCWREITSIRPYQAPGELIEDSVVRVYSPTANNVARYQHNAGPASPRLTQHYANAGRLTLLSILPPDAAPTSADNAPTDRVLFAPPPLLTCPTLTRLKINPYSAEIFLNKPRRPKGSVQFVIIINVLVSSFCFIWIPMLWVYGY